MFIRNEVIFLYSITGNESKTKIIFNKNLDFYKILFTVRKNNIDCQRKNICRSNRNNSFS